MLCLSLSLWVKLNLPSSSGPWDDEASNKPKNAKMTQRLIGPSEMYDKTETGCRCSTNF